MVIELLEGQALSNMLEKKQKFSTETVIKIGVQICSALSYAHRNGIVHRDIKPANIMYSQDHTAKLTDFGIAQLGNDKMALTQAGSILGSILYIPPEQLVDSRRVDQRADIYSLGVTLFQLFTGRLPFEGESVAEVITKILNQDIPSMKSFEPSLPDALDKVILKSMKKEPNERFSEVGDLGKALTEVGEYLKNPSYKLDPALFGEPVVPQIIKNNGNPKTDKLPPIGDYVARNALKTDTVLLKKTSGSQKSGTGSLSKGKAAPAKAKTALPLIIGGITIGVIGLVTVLSMVFGGEKPEPGRSVTKPVSRVSTTPAKTNKIVPVVKAVVAQPVTKKPVVTKPVSVSKSQAASKPRVVIPQRITPVRTVARTAPRSVVKRTVAVPVRVRKAVAQPVRKVAVKKAVRPAATAKKSMGEGY